MNIFAADRGRNSRFDGSPHLSSSRKTSAMTCCQPECPHFSTSAGETEICDVCDREFLVAHLEDAVREVDHAIEFVNWRFCVDRLQAMDPKNSQLVKIRTLLEAMDSTRSQLMQQFGISHPRRTAKGQSAV